MIINHSPIGNQLNSPFSKQNISVGNNESNDDYKNKLVKFFTKNPQLFILILILMVIFAIVWKIGDLKDFFGIK